MSSIFKLAALMFWLLILLGCRSYIGYGDIRVVADDIAESHLSFRNLGKYAILKIDNHGDGQLELSQIVDGVAGVKLVHSDEFILTYYIHRQCYFRIAAGAVYVGPDPIEVLPGGSIELILDLEEFVALESGENTLAECLKANANGIWHANCLVMYDGEVQELVSKGVLWVGE